MTPGRSPSARLRALAVLLREVEDVLAERVSEPTPPAWCTERGWSTFLLGLDEATLERCEHGETARVMAELEGAPASLRRLANEVLEETRLDRLEVPGGARPLRRASERKRMQVAALAGLVEAWAPRAERVVDLGAGHGHLTRELSACLGVTALGVEARAHVVANAQALTESDAVRFVRRDALADPLDFGPGDLLVGLHACGALGDAIASAAAERGAGVLLVSCCPQKVGGDARAPLSALGHALGLRVPRAQLGLANLATLAEGAKDSAAVMMRRRTRRALFLLLRDAGVPLALGDEINGVSRRQPRHGVAALSARVFEARGLPLPSAAAIEDAEARAAHEHAAIRRLALPRTMLARALELALVFDRAALLEEAGGEPVRVLEAFDRSASPRNVALLRAPGPR